MPIPPGFVTTLVSVVGLPNGNLTGVERVGPGQFQRLPPVRESLIGTARVSVTKELVRFHSGSTDKGR